MTPPIPGDYRLFSKKIKRTRKTLPIPRNLVGTTGLQPIWVP